MPKRYSTLQARAYVNKWAESGLSPLVFALQNGFDPSTIRKWINDPSINKTGKTYRRVGQYDPEAVLKQYANGLTYKEIANQLGISEQTVGRVVRSHPEADHYHKGGVISKTIPVNIDIPAVKSKIKIEEAQPMAIIPAKVAEPETSKPILKLSTVQVKGQYTGFRYNLGENLVISDKLYVDIDNLQGFIEELQRLANLAIALRE